MFRDAHCLCRGPVMHSIDILDLQEMVPASERRELRSTTLLSPVGYLARKCTFDCAVCFCAFDVTRFSVTLLGHPTRSSLEHLIDFSPFQLHAALCPRTAVHITKYLIDKL